MAGPDDADHAWALLLAGLTEDRAERPGLGDGPLEGYDRDRPQIPPSPDLPSPDIVPGGSLSAAPTTPDDDPFDFEFVPTAPTPPDDAPLDFEFDTTVADQEEAARLVRETPAFWTVLNSAYDPKLQFRFKVTIEGLKFEDKPGWRPPDDFNDNADRDNGVAWYAKSVDKPALSYHKMDEDRRMNPSMPVLTTALVDSPIYKPINMVLVDPTYPNVTRKIIRWMRRSGLNENTARKIIAKAGKSNERSFLDTIGDVTIEQLAPDGRWLEKWILRDAFPADISFGKLDYSSNDLVEISMTWYYTSFTVEFAGAGNYTEGSAGQIGKEDGYPYFSDEAPAPLTVPSNPQTACDHAWAAAEQGDFPGGKTDFIRRGNCPGVSGDEKAATEAAGGGAPPDTTHPSGEIDAITFATPDEIPFSEEEAAALIADLEAGFAADEAAKNRRDKYIDVGVTPSYGYTVKG